MGGKGNLYTLKCKILGPFLGSKNGKIGNSTVEC